MKRLKNSRDHLSVNLLSSVIKEVIKSLSSIQIKELFNFIGEIISRNITASNLSNEFKENRFSNGEVCMYCGSTHINKHGKVRDKQRYKCLDCIRIYIGTGSVEDQQVELNAQIQEDMICYIVGYIRAKNKA